MLCRESGVYPTYRSDEHGFNNPAGLSNIPDAHNIAPLKAQLEAQASYRLEFTDPVERVLQEVYSAVTSVIANAWRAVAPPIV